MFNPNFFLWNICLYFISNWALIIKMIICRKRLKVSILFKISGNHFCSFSDESVFIISHSCFFKGWFPSSTLLPLPRNPPRGAESVSNRHLITGDYPGVGRAIHWYLILEAGFMNYRGSKWRGLSVESTIIIMRRDKSAFYTS